jgi:signal transduction histidine kinase
MRIGLKLRASLIVAPLVVAMLALAVAPIGSYLSLRAALHDVRREIAFLLHRSRLDLLAVRQSVELVDATQIERSLALRKALDSLLASSARLSMVMSPAGLAADAQSLRTEAAEAISVARLASSAQRLVGKYRGFAHFGGSREELAVAEHGLDRAYRIWEAQVGARGEGAAANAPASEGEIHAGYRALKKAVGGLAGLDPRRDPAEVLRIYESQLEPLGNETLPRVLTAAFEVRDARISALVDSIGRRSRFAGVATSAVAVLAMALALLCPWLISRWIVQPVHTLTRAARELGAGLGTRPVAVHAGGELGELAATFNQMAQQLEERTRELEAERARERLHHTERLAAVGTLAAGVAHQINNPLNNLLLTAQNALGDDGPEAARHWRAALEACTEEAKRCERIVRGLVAFSRGEPGQKWPEDANQVLRRARDLAADTAADIEILLCEGAVPILANSIALEQALVNIIRNAIQSRPRAHVTLRTERRNGTVRIAVRDDGYGVDSETIRHLFEPFFTTRTADGGTGLGLSVAHRIIAEHDGTITIDSRPGEGTLVSVELPLAPAGEARR